MIFFTYYCVFKNSRPKIKKVKFLHTENKFVDFRGFNYLEWEILLSNLLLSIRPMLLSIQIPFLCICQAFPLLCFYKFLVFILVHSLCYYSLRNSNLWFFSRGNFNVYEELQMRSILQTHFLEKNILPPPQMLQFISPILHRQRWFVIVCACLCLCVFCLLYKKT